MTVDWENYSIHLLTTGWPSLTTLCNTWQNFQAIIDCEDNGILRTMCQKVLPPFSCHVPRIISNKKQKKIANYHLLINISEVKGIGGRSRVKMPNPSQFLVCYSPALLTILNYLKWFKSYKTSRRGCFFQKKWIFVPFCEIPFEIFHKELFLTLSRVRTFAYL